MAAWIFVLFAAIGQALADEKINCHFTPDSVSQLFAADQPSWVDKCDRLIVKIGSPLEDGKLRPVSTAIMNHMIEARNGRQGLELLAEVFLRPEHMDPLAEEDYRSTLARSLKIVALDNDLNGVVVNIEDNYIPHPPDFRSKGKVTNLLAKIRSNLGRAQTIGVVTGGRGPFGHMESHDCQNVANLVTFVELSAETFDLDGHREVKSDNFVASRPIEDAEVHLKAVQLSKALLAKWLHCEFPAHKLLLTAPQPTGISELPGQRQVMNLRYESICNRRATWYEGADLPLMSLKQETAGGDEVAKYWVSFVNERSLSKIVQNGRQKQVSGFSILSINYDDGRDRCGKGNYPLLNQLFELAERTPVTPKPTPQPTARPTPQPSVSDSTRLREICQVVTKHCQDL